MTLTLTRAASLAVALAACSKSPGNDPSAVADRFVDLYLVEIDQDGALPLTTGPARERVQEELAEVEGVRATGYSANDAKPRVFYERTMFQADGQGGSARAIYDIRIKHGDTETRRHILVSLHDRDGGAWKVSSFFLRDGPADRPE